jgi:hypothetical protein
MQRTVTPATKRKDERELKDRRTLRTVWRSP